MPLLHDLSELKNNHNILFMDIKPDNLVFDDKKINLIDKTIFKINDKNSEYNSSSTHLYTQLKTLKNI